MAKGIRYEYTTLFSGCQKIEFFLSSLFMVWGQHLASGFHRIRLVGLESHPDQLGVEGLGGFMMGWGLYECVMWLLASIFQTFTCYFFS